MRLVFTLFSIAYVAGIFLFADSSVVSYLKAFNPNSLLHIPLYGILTILIILSFFPLKYESNVPKAHNHSNVPYGPNASTHLRFKASTRFLISGFIALIVAIADEIHQSLIPTRDASGIDVFLDFVGIVLALLIISQLHKKRRTKNPLSRIYA